MSNDSNSYDILRLSTDSGIDINDSNQTVISNKNSQPSSGYVTRSKKAVR